MINEHVPEDAPLAWLDHKHPNEVHPKAYGHSYDAFVDSLLAVSDSARKIARGKYWDRNDDVCITTNMNPETGYWGMATVLRYNVRKEIRDGVLQRAKDPTWDLGSRSEVVTHITEVPDATLHATIMRLSNSERRDMMKMICSSDYYSMAEDVNPDGPYLDELKNFIRTAYEALMRGQVHCAFGITDAPPIPAKAKGSSAKRRRKK